MFLSLSRARVSLSYTGNLYPLPDSRFDVTKAWLDHDKAPTWSIPIDRARKTQSSDLNAGRAAVRLFVAFRRRFLNPREESFRYVARVVHSNSVQRMFRGPSARLFTSAFSSMALPSHRIGYCILASADGGCP